MPCERRDLGDGRFAVVCTRGRRSPCVSCGRPATLLCDYPVAGTKRGTCDRAFCRDHGVNVGPDRDYCLAHAEHARKRGEIQNA